MAMVINMAKLIGNTSYTNAQSDKRRQHGYP